MVEIGLACGQGHHLRLAGALQIIELDEAFADARAHRSVPWLRSSIRLLSAQMLDQPLALAQVDRDALIIVEADLARAPASPSG
jgi:hypothetical protein